MDENPKIQVNRKPIWKEPKHTREDLVAIRESWSCNPGIFSIREDPERRGRLVRDGGEHKRWHGVGDKGHVIQGPWTFQVQIKIHGTTTRFLWCWLPLWREISVFFLRFWHFLKVLFWGVICGCKVVTIGTLWGAIWGEHRIDEDWWLWWWWWVKKKIWRMHRESDSMSNFTMALPLASCDKGVNKLFNEIKIKKRKKKNFPVVAPTTKKKGTCTCLSLFFYLQQHFQTTVIVGESRTKQRKIWLRLFKEDIWQRKW